MKFNFKIQQYQTEAVEAVVKVFAGQGMHDGVSYIRDVGKQKTIRTVQGEEITQGEQIGNLFDEDIDYYSDTGYKNEAVGLSDEQLLTNIQELQKRQKHQS